ncbi:type VI secretion system-associated FHA domain protein TagH [Sphingomonas profundi]|uniref:type VI secretion system-associated FHA domain protein TagH n=1 Tax=Alterirhizorhabdus profundi TaxID=2681549 RepID=UPI0012E80DEE|nr:type VI secretion system-associated FHA domain protein TagH [Sphingomonas profundi]
MWTLLLSKVDQPGIYIDRRQVDGGELRVGRSADKADWVIADPEGHLSRHHCTIAAVGLDLFVIDMSTNGVALNHAGGRVVPQQPVPIRVRDKLLLGDYLIEIATEGAGAGVSLQPPPPPLPAGASGGLTQPDMWFDGSADPIWGVGAPSQEVHEFLGSAMHDFLAPVPGPSFGASDPWAGPMSDAFSKPILAPMAPVADAFSIPEDWAAPGGGAGARTPNPFAMPSPAVRADPFAPDPFAPDPFAQPPSGRGAPPPDPFAGFAPPPVADVFARPPHDPFAPPGGSNPFADPLHDPFAPTPGVPEPAFDAVRADPFAPAEAKTAHDPFDLGAPRPAADIFADLPADPFADGMPAPTIDPFADFVPATATDLPADASIAPSPPPAVPRAGAATDAGDWAAFCEGAGLAPEDMRGSPEAMRRLGTLYRQVVLGLSDLIQDRAAFKDEFRVERTQLSFGRNNPLKHLPALESAKLLLGDPLPGFMPADEAVRTAFEDVKKHQLAMLAGVQHALTAVFERLAPAEIERIMKKAAGERKALPFGRGVNPWTVYQTVFDALRLDAASNVNSVMSVAFREGYEAFLKSAK